MRRYLLLVVTLGAIGCIKEPFEPSVPAVGFFVTSATSATGNLGGLTGADATCQRLAVAAGYGGPCPPIGRHRYFHKLYALDTVLPDLNRPTKAQLEKAMQSHVLEKFELIGTYQKD